MLASLLPGLRELRAPLAAGYLWLVAAWLALAGAIPDPDEAPPGIVRDAYELAGAVGQPAVVAAASFAAYLAGVLSVQATAAMLPRLRVLRRRQVLGSRFGVAAPSAAGRSALREAVLDELVRRYDLDPGLQKLLQETRDACGESRDLDDLAVRRRLLDVRVDVDEYAGRLERDLPMIPLRLLAEGKKDEIYGEFDRLRAEAEFRASVAVPLGAVVAILAWRASPWWLFALVMPALLLLEAGRNVTAAADVLAESVRARAAESPVLAHLQAGGLEHRKDWVERAATMGYARAMARLAADMDQAGGPEAETWYRRAADSGEPSAMRWLAGRLHQAGDPAAERWYADAARAGDPAAVQIAERARELAPQEVADLKAAHAGDLAAMTRVGQHFEAREQPADAEEWYRRAGEAGHGPARAAMAALLRRRGMAAAASAWDEDSGTPAGSTGSRQQ